MITLEKFETICEDDVVLRGLLVKPPKPKAVVQFNGGTAARKEFYLPFLEYLAENGFACCLWDYRGSGDSAPPSLKGCNYTFSDYGRKDMPAIKSYLRSSFPDLPLLLFTHSVGGQQVGLMDDLHDYKGMVGYAVSTGYLPNMPFWYRVKSYYFFYVFAPISHRIFGYLRAKEFGYMEDLPKNVLLEWRKWCAKKTYFFDEKYANKTVPVDNFSNIPFPVHIFWANDDPISNKKNIHNFWKNVSSTHGISFTEISPKDLGLKKMEHFGFYNKKRKDHFWEMGLQKLNEYLDV